MAQTARGLALEALDRIERGAFANLVLPPMLARSDLDERDRHFATELVYGVTRMRRACDWLVDRFVMKPPERRLRNLLRVGAYQLVFTKTPPHAAVSATVAEAPKSARGFVNAVLRKVAAAGEPEWPDVATRLSYPEWIVERLVADLGEDDALASLEQMNRPPRANVRPDGYVQDEASRRVADAVGVEEGERVADICAAPGGKATIFGHRRAAVVAAVDLQHHRARLIAENAAAVGTSNVAPVTGDGRRLPLRPNQFDRVLLDAPCSGLGVLRRRADARWRMKPAFVSALAGLQRGLLTEALPLLRPGGVIAYSVCTLTDAETVEIDDWLAATQPELEALDPPASPWQRAGRGARLLPHLSDTDGMYLLRLRVPAQHAL